MNGYNSSLKNAEPLTSEQRRDRVKGALFGFVVGDAMGLSTKYMLPAEINRRFGVLSDIIGGGRHLQDAGDITDNTKLMLCVANGIIKKPKYPITTIGEYFIEWFSKNPRDISSSTRATICMAKGLSNTPEAWRRAAINTKTALSSKTEGNNALARCLYPALYYKNLSDAEKTAVMQAKMTHFGNETVSAVTAYTNIIWNLVNFNVPKNATISSAMGNIVFMQKPRPSSYVKDTLYTACYFAYHKDKLEDIITSAVNIGGESDTISALAGAIAGACFGYSKIPEKWIEKIKLDVKSDIAKIEKSCY